MSHFVEVVKSTANLDSFKLNQSYVALKHLGHTNIIVFKNIEPHSKEHTNIISRIKEKPDYMHFYSPNFGYDYYNYRSSLSRYFKTVESIKIYYFIS